MSEVTEEMSQAVDDWESVYKPINNHIDPNSSWNGTMFETYGEEFDFVYAQSDANVWTWVDGDEGTWIISGRAYVNRIGYFVTELPHNGSVALQVDKYSDEYEDGL
jgi:hypothetical protein